MNRSLWGLQAALPVAVLLAGCASPNATGTSNGWSPPLKVCGQTLNQTPAGAVLTDASVKPRVVGMITSQFAVFIKLAPDCDRGADLTIDPASHAVIIAKATATDGLLVGVGIRSPVTTTARVLRSDGSTSLVEIPASPPGVA